MHTYDPDQIVIKIYTDQMTEDFKGVLYVRHINELRRRDTGVYYPVNHNVRFGRLGRKDWNMDTGRLHDNIESLFA